MRGLFAILFLLVLISSCLGARDAGACPPGGCQDVSIIEEGPLAGNSDVRYGGVSYDPEQDKDVFTIDGILFLEPDPEHTEVWVVYKHFDQECTINHRGNEVCVDVLVEEEERKILSYGYGEESTPQNNCSDAFGCSYLCAETETCYFCNYYPHGEWRYCDEVKLSNWGSCENYDYLLGDCGECDVGPKISCCQNPLDCSSHPWGVNPGWNMALYVCDTVKCAIHVQFRPGTS